MTMAWLGGYVTPEQAQELGIRNSVPRIHGQLKDLESWGFIKRISTYPGFITPRFRPTVTTSSAAATGYVSTLQADLACGLALHRF
jgi:hypothetical protein